MQWTRGELTIDTDRGRLDMDLLARWIRETYWAPRRPRHAVRRAWDESAVVFGLYRGDDMIGWARVVTDLVSIAYLADVFILPEQRGQGLGRWLVETILAYPDLQRAAWILHTRDAHALYEQFGFKRMGERLMERPRTLPAEQD